MDSPMDSGWSWVVMFASFFINIVTFGLVKSGGVVYVAFMEELHVNRSDAAFATTLIFSLSCLLAPLTTALTIRFYHKYVIFCGALIASISLALAAIFYENFNCVILFYGIGTGIGVGLVMVPNVTVVHHHFDKHRAFAVGFVMAGGSVGAFAVPPPLELILQNYNLQAALLYMSTVVMHICPAALLLRPRNIIKTENIEQGISLLEEFQPNVASSPRTKVSKCFAWVRLELSVFCEKQFLLLLSSSIAFGIVWSSYLTFLQEYVLTETSKHVQPIMAVHALTAMSAGDLVCRVVFGWVSDRGWVQKKRAYIFFLTVTSLLLMAYAADHSYESVLILSVIFGIFISGVIVLPPVLIYDFVGPKRFQVALGISSCFNGITMLIAVPCLAYIREMSGTYKTCFIAMGISFLSATFCWLLDEFYSWIRDWKTDKNPCTPEK